MPTYEYICKSCGHELEIFQSMKDGPKRKCPACGKNTLERKIGIGAAVLFKGSGFYQTDYRSEAYKKSAESDKKPAEATKTDAGSKSDGSAKKPDGAKAETPKSEPKPESKTGSKPEPKSEGKRSSKKPARGGDR